MIDFSDEFRVEKMRSGNAAVYQLKEQFEKFAGTPQKIDVCESIALCFYQLEQFQDAGSWYETAGRLILSEPSATPAIKALSALNQFEKALDSYRRDGEEDKITECLLLIRELKRASASA